MTIPRSLAQAVSQGRIVPFVGSGASMAVKQGLFPSWDGLLLNLAEKLDEEANQDTAEIVRRFVKKKQLNKAADETCSMKFVGFLRESKPSLEIHCC